MCDSLSTCFPRTVAGTANVELDTVASTNFAVHVKESDVNVTRRLLSNVKMQKSSSFKDTLLRQNCRFGAWIGWFESGMTTFVFVHEEVESNTQGELSVVVIIIRPPRITCHAP